MLTALSTLKDLLCMRRFARRKSNIKLSDETIFTTRLRYEDKTDALEAIDLNKKVVFQSKRSSIRLELKHRLSKDFGSRIRLETVYVDFDNNKPEEFGAAGFAEINWRVSEIIKVGGRLSYFSTESYSSAIWQFEYAMPGYMTTPALAGNGMRSFVYLKIEPFDAIDIWLRYAVTSKNYADRMSSGLTEISGNSMKMFYVQIEFGI